MIENISFKQEFALGAAIGLLVIILNAALGFVIGIPLFSFSTETERYATQTLAAPIVEELTFRSILPFILITIGLPLIIAGLLTVASFVAFHYYAYGSSFEAASSLFIGAAVFGVTAFLATYYTGDASEFQVPIAAITAHFMINVWLVFKYVGLVVVGAG